MNKQWEQNLKSGALNTPSISKQEMILEKEKIQSASKLAIKSLFYYLKKKKKKGSMYKTSAQDILKQFTKRS